MDLRHQLPWLMELFATDFPSDAFLVEQYIAPLFHGLFEREHILESLHVMRAVDEIPKQIRRRTGGNANIQYKVGQIFRHRRYHYEAIITGWDSECGAGEQWMRRMGIDRLEAGRHQSFYHVLWVVPVSSSWLIANNGCIVWRIEVSDMWPKKTLG
jgi:hemimethylated DNA binding domain